MNELSTLFEGPFDYDINIYVVAQNTLNDIAVIYGSLLHLNQKCTPIFLVLLTSTMYLNGELRACLDIGAKFDVDN